MYVEKWNERYRSTELVWSAGPNRFVEAGCRDLPPGRSIDLAAGEGRNAIWLAEQGWDSTAVDFAEVAVDKAQQLAMRRGVTITTEVADLNEYVPEPGGYDLVVMAYLHLPAEQLDPILVRAAAAVAPGGTFFLVGHDATNITDGYGGPQYPEVLTSTDQVIAALGDAFEIEVAEVANRHVATDDGEQIALDTHVIARRPVA